MKAKNTLGIKSYHVVFFLNQESALIFVPCPFFFSHELWHFLSTFSLCVIVIPLPVFCVSDSFDHAGFFDQAFQVSTCPNCQNSQYCTCQENIIIRTIQNLRWNFEPISSYCNYCNLITVSKSMTQSSLSTQVLVGVPIPFQMKWCNLIVLYLYSMVFFKKPCLQTFFWIFF